MKAKQETLIQLNFVENVTKINRADGKVIDIITSNRIFRLAGESYWEDIFLHLI